MNKHIKVIGILLVLSTFLFTGCSKIGSNPKDSLSKYLDAFYHGTHEEVYQCISGKDKATKDLQKYLAEQAVAEQAIGGGRLALTQVYFSKLSYEIKEVKVTGNQAKAEVTITAPDAVSMVADIMSATFMSVFEGEKNVDETEKMLAEKYKDK